MKNLFYILSTALMIFCTACGQEVITPEPDANYQEPIIANGSFGGYLRDVPNFYVESTDISLSGTYNIDMYGSALSSTGDEWVVMSRIALNHGSDVWQLEPGVYQQEGYGDVIGVACGGEERGQWYYDSVAQGTMVVISDTDEYRVLEFEHRFSDSYNNEGYLSGVVNLPYN